MRLFVGVMNLWNARRGCKAALAAIAPLFERTRRLRGQLRETNWADPYVLGFVTTLITSAARADEEDLGATALGIVHWDVWKALIGGDPTLVAERAVLLSLSGDPEFAAGCASALAFRAALRERDAPSGNLPSEAVCALWDEAIGNRLDVAGDFAPTSANSLRI